MLNVVMPATDLDGGIVYSGCTSVHRILMEASREFFEIF